MPGSDARKRLILALDVETSDEALSLAHELGDYVGMFKVGLELFCRSGPQIFQDLRKFGHEIFFDGKFLDIPNTVGKASRAACCHGVKIFNVHATGGKEMMRAALAQASQISAELKQERPKVIAVTVLTSISQSVLQDEVGIKGELGAEVERLALYAKECGLDGVVASAQEAERLRKRLGQDFLIITPGIRLKGGENQDQSRVVSPYDAIKSGADLLVVGRTITACADRIDCAKRVLFETEEALALV